MIVDNSSTVSAFVICSLKSDCKVSISQAVTSCAKLSVGMSKTVIKNITAIFRLRLAPIQIFLA